MRGQARIAERATKRRRVVDGVVNYTGEMSERPRYFANDHSRDNLILDPRTVEIEDARFCADPPSLEREGFALIPHKSAVWNFRDRAEVARVYTPEIERLLLELSGADEVIISGAGILRFGERSPEAGSLMNSWPARFIHIDISDAPAADFAARALGSGREALGRKRRYALYNVWRALTPPPQDVPLAICDARSVSPHDLIPADAVFDAPGAPEWGFEGLLLRFNPAHRWLYFSRMTREEALVFKTFDSDPGEPHHCPHSAFDDATCPAGVPARMSIEIRGIAFFDA